MPRKIANILIIIVSLNLIISGLIAYAVDSDANLGIFECEDQDPEDLIEDVSCIDITADFTLSPTGNSPLFIGDSAQTIFLRTNYSSSSNQQKINIMDARRSGEFWVSANISELTLSTNPAIVLPVEQIGMITYNTNEAQTVDGINYIDASSPPQSLLDRGIKGDSEFDLEASTNAAAFGTRFNMFTNDPDSSHSTETMVIQAPNPPAGYFGSYQFGFGLVFSFPANSLLPTEDGGYNLTEGNYTATLTFTLST